MKIVFLSDEFPPKSAGSGIVAFWQAKELSRRGHEVSIITSTQEMETAGISQYEGLKIYSLYSRYPSRFRSYISIYNPRIIKRVRRILKEIHPDIIHVHNVHQYLSYACLKEARYYSKIFITFHDAMAVSYGKIYPVNGRTDYKISALEQMRFYWRAWNPLRRYFINKYLRFVNVKFAVSDSLRKALEANGIKHIELLYNGIDPNGLKVSKEEVSAFKKKFDLNGKKIMLFGGRVGKAKGGDVALKVLDMIEDPHVVLLIVGKENDYLKELIQKSSGRIIAVGWLERKEMNLAYDVSSVVLVLSTYLDPFPTVNLEAMASKKPVIGTILGGTKELVVDRHTGYVVNPMNIEEIAKKAEILLNNSELASEMGEAGFIRVTREFNLKSQIDALESYYGR